MVLLGIMPQALQAEKKKFSEETNDKKTQNLVY